MAVRAMITLATLSLIPMLKLLTLQPAVPWFAVKPATNLIFINDL